MKENISEDIKHFMDKVKEIEKNEQVDLSSDEDLSIGIMNLISIEEHLFFTANKTGKSQYYDLLNEVREVRKDLLKKIIKDYEGEVWCISKHLLASSMRLMEVGTKFLGKGDKKNAEDLFKKAYNLYSLFWGLNLKLIDLGDTEEVANSADEKPEPEDVKFVSEKSNEADKQGSVSIFEKLGKVVQKAIDCCRE